jgi:hypothetical protein
MQATYAEAGSRLWETVALQTHRQAIGIGIEIAQWPMRLGATSPHVPKMLSLSVHKTHFRVVTPSSFWLGETGGNGDPHLPRCYVGEGDGPTR